MTVICLHDGHFFSPERSGSMGVYEQLHGCFSCVIPFQVFTRNRPLQYVILIRNCTNGAKTAIVATRKLNHLGIRIGQTLNEIGSVRVCRFGTVDIVNERVANGL
jgi:hypothetical protein